MPDDLTPDEQQYLKQVPPGSLFPIDEPVFQKRLDLAKKFCARFLETDPTLSADMKAVYQQYPLWGFYEGTNGRGIYQHWGIAQRENGDDVLMVVSCHVGVSNLIAGGILVKDVRRVDRWNEDQLSIIALNQDAAMFADPLGFLLALAKYYD